MWRDINVVQKKKNMIKPDEYWRERLTDDEFEVCRLRGTEAPFSGKLLHNHKTGVYSCTCCQTPLFLSDNKYDSGCGWPSFDNEIKNSVKRTPDPDGRRIEITCSNCDGHLGHVFTGENMTPANVRHCVNSLSIKFVSY